MGLCVVQIDRPLPTRRARSLDDPIFVTFVMHPSDALLELDDDNASKMLSRPAAASIAVRGGFAVSFRKGKDLP